MKIILFGASKIAYDYLSQLKGNIIILAIADNNWKQFQLSSSGYEEDINMNRIRGGG